MTAINRVIVISLVVTALICVSGGSAQDDRVKDLGPLAPQEDVDSYWLDANTWAFYGYRPHVKANLSRFTTLPSYFAGQNYYAYGVNPPSGAALAPALNKDQFQMTKYGTWH